MITKLESMLNISQKIEPREFLQQKVNRILEFCFQRAESRNHMFTCQSSMLRFENKSTRAVTDSLQQKITSNACCSSPSRAYIKHQLLHEHLINSMLFHQIGLHICETVKIKMYAQKIISILIFSFVGGYSLSEYESLPNINSSNTFGDSDLSLEPLMSDGGHATYEILKNIQNYVYPKLYKSVESIGNTKSSRNITLDDIENDSLYTKLDQNLIESKHGNIDGGSAENGLSTTNLLQMGSSGNLSTALQLIDPLFLMAVLGFIVYIINAVLSLVDKLHLTKLLGTSSSSFYRIHRRQQEAAMPSFDVNQNFLVDLERLFRLAIEMYERKI